MLKIREAFSVSAAGWLKSGVYGAFLLLIYFSSLHFLVSIDWAREDYTHCFLIPFVVIYLIWEKKQELSETPSLPSWTGLVPFLIGVILFWLGELGGELFAQYLSIWFVIVGLLWLHLGWQKIKTIWFALVMMLTMFPLPYFITTKITFQLRLISSKLGVWMLHLYGMSAHREGNVIDIGFTQLQVVDACSGLRYVIPLMVLSLLLAYWFKAHLWKRLVLFLSSIPLAIVINSFRIAVTGILYSTMGAKVAEGFFHGFSGWLIFIFAIPILLLGMWILKWLPPRTEGRNAGLRDYGLGISNEKAEGRGTRDEGRGAARKVLQPQFVVAIVLLVATLAVSKTIEFREKIPIAKPFNQFPAEIGEWTGKRQVMEQQFLNVLYFSDYIIADFRNSQGKDVNFYVAYYESQRKGESIHSPETCLPGSGWAFTQSGTATIALAGNNPKSITVNRAFMEKSGVRELVYFWFPMRGRVITKLWEVKVANFWDAMTRQRTDGALVRVITPVYGNEKIEEAEARLAGFTKEIVPILDQFIPK